MTAAASQGRRTAGEDPVPRARRSSGRVRDRRGDVLQRTAGFRLRRADEGTAKGFCPEALCELPPLVLQTPGATYSYCNEPAPGQGGKICREIGAAKSFKEKVDNNDIWKIHQRVYKKYFARVSKGKMSRPDFEVWAREAERMCDEALAEDEMARDKAAHEQIVHRLPEELNRV